MAAIGVISKVIDAFKSMLAGLEKAGGDAIKEISSMSVKVADDLKVAMSGVFKEIKTRISRLIQALKTRIDSITKRRTATSLGPNATSFTSKLENVMKEGERIFEKLAKDFSEVMESMIKEVKLVLSKVANFFEAGATDVGDFGRKATHDVWNELDKIGKSAMTDLERAGTDVGKEFEVSADFAYKHGLVAAEAGTLAILGPELVLGLGVSAAIIIGATRYHP